jgi:hypothetical protein
MISAVWRQVGIEKSMPWINLPAVARRFSLALRHALTAAPGGDGLPAPDFAALP